MADKLLIKLLKSVLRNNVHGVLKSLEQGANPNGFEDNDMIRPLHMATVVEKSEAISEILILFGADPFAKSAEGFSPYDLAQMHNNMKLLDIFKSCSAPRTIH